MTGTRTFGFEMKIPCFLSAKRFVKRKRDEMIPKNSMSGSLVFLEVTKMKNRTMIVASESLGRNESNRRGDEKSHPDAIAMTVMMKVVGEVTRSIISDTVPAPEVGAGVEASAVTAMIVITITRDMAKEMTVAMI
jgi:hypothetical protein